jgi:hypothetical protein
MWRLSHLEAVFVKSLSHFETETVVAAAAVAVAFAEVDEKKGNLQDIPKLLICVHQKSWIGYNFHFGVVQ